MSEMYVSVSIDDPNDLTVRVSGAGSIAVYAINYALQISLDPGAARELARKLNAEADRLAAPAGFLGNGRGVKEAADCD